MAKWKPHRPPMQLRDEIARLRHLHEETEAELERKRDALETAHVQFRKAKVCQRLYSTRDDAAGRIRRSGSKKKTSGSAQPRTSLSGGWALRPPRRCSGRRSAPRVGHALQFALHLTCAVPSKFVPSYEPSSPLLGGSVRRQFSLKSPPSDDTKKTFG